MVPFHAKAELKQNSARKNLNVTNINTKTDLPNRQIGLRLNHLFFYESKRPPFGDTIIFDSFIPPLYAFKNYEWSFVTLFFLFEYFQS